MKDYKNTLKENDLEDVNGGVTIIDSVDAKSNMNGFEASNKIGFGPQGLQGLAGINVQDLAGIDVAKLSFADKKRLARNILNDAAVNEMDEASLTLKLREKLRSFI